MVSHLLESWPDAALAGWTGPGWYFWCEDFATCIGPYATKDEAHAEAERYVEWLTTGGDHAVRGDLDA
jgi:hypothetical protein